MFRSIRLTGTAGTILWGYQEAAGVVAWTIVRRDRSRHAPAGWTFSARCAWVDEFRLRQSRLLFTAPRDKGRWCWAIKPDTIRVRGTTVQAELGQPEQ